MFILQGATKYYETGNEREREDIIVGGEESRGKREKMIEEEQKYDLLEKKI